MYHIIKSEIFSLTLLASFPWTTLIYLKCAHRKLRTVLRRVSDTIHFDLLTSLPSDTAILRGKAKHGQWLNIFNLP